MSQNLHRDLCTKAAKWLDRRCTFAVSEPPIPGIELPDALGWKGAVSFLIEVKTSRSDFHSDKYKNCRVHDHLSIGDYRWFLAPKGILTEEDLPENWGLLEAYGKTHRIKELVKPKQIRDRPITALRSDLLAVSYMANRLLRYQDFNKETMRFNPIENNVRKR